MRGETWHFDQLPATCVMYKLARNAVKLPILAAVLFSLWTLIILNVIGTFVFSDNKREEIVS